MKRQIASTILFCLAAPAGADSLVPLRALLSEPIEESYQNVRCAGFFLANIEWAGQALSEDVFEDSKSAISALLLVATLQRSAKTNGSLEDLAKTVNADTRAIADVYLVNYRQNYAVTGRAWDGNPLWESDAAECRPISDVALMLIDEIEKGDQ